MSGANWTEEQFAEYLTRLKMPPADAPKPSNVRESFIEAECTKILEADGWRSLKTDPVSDRSRGKGFGELGMADTLMLRYDRDMGWAQVMWCEWKAPGGKPAKHQTAWHIRERARGALTLIAGEDFEASIEGFRKWYAESGLRRIA
jgi:hypothetical protein